MCSVPKTPKMPKPEPAPPPPAPPAEIRVNNPYENTEDINPDVSKGTQRKRTGFQSLRIKRRNSIGTGM